MVLCFHEDAAGVVDIVQVVGCEQLLAGDAVERLGSDGRQRHVGAYVNTAGHTHTLMSPRLTIKRVGISGHDVAYFTQASLGIAPGWRQWRQCVAHEEM